MFRSVQYIFKLAALEIVVFTVCFMAWFLEALGFDLDEGKNGQEF